jgi:hypothetical protein
MRHFNDDPEHFRKRAQEMRIIANSLTGMVRAKDSILRFAEEYEKKAVRVEGRLRGGTAARRGDAPPSRHPP